jgi:putative redox protein
MAGRGLQPHRPDEHFAGLLHDDLDGHCRRRKDIPLNGLKARMVKHMAAEPRRVQRIELHFELEGQGLDPRQRSILENAARTCPVARSLREDLVQDVHFTYL